MVNDLLLPVHQSSLRDTVLPALRKAIMSGQLRAGARLSETEIARTMRVSRAPVREALAHLEQEGLVERIPNRGAFVADAFSPQAVAEIAGLRNCLELYALQLAAPKITETELSRLYEICQQLQIAVERRDFDQIAAVDYDFHAAIVAAAGHRRLRQMWATLAGQYWMLYLPAIQQLGVEIDSWGRNHRAIIDSLRDKRLDLAVMHLEYNILNSAEHLQEIPNDAPMVAHDIDASQ